MIRLRFLLALLLVTTGGEILHVHADETPGYYNEEHVLESLAARSADAPPAETPSAGIAATPAAATPATAEAIAPAAPILASDSRAPPSA